MASNLIIVRKQLRSLHKSPIVCDHSQCDHKFCVGEKAVRMKTRNPRYLCPECNDSLYF